MQQQKSWRIKTITKNQINLVQFEKSENSTKILENQEWLKNWRKTYAKTYIKTGTIKKE